VDHAVPSLGRPPDAGGVRPNSSPRTARVRRLNIAFRHGPTRLKVGRDPHGLTAAGSLGVDSRPVVFTARTR
jgi:hypothetical protein